MPGGSRPLPASLSLSGSSGGSSSNNSNNGGALSDASAPSSRTGIGGWRSGRAGVCAGAGASSGGSVAIQARGNERAMRLVAGVLAMLVLLLASFMAVEAKWYCGTDENNEKLTREMVERDCPRQKARINHCCREHDQCYDRQRGQAACDTAFCNCMQVYTKASPTCSLNESNLFCNAVRLFGGLRYLEAGRKPK